MNNVPEQLNEYMTGVLMRSKDAMDLQMWTEAVDDAKIASQLGVSNDEEYKDFHYIDLFAEELIDDVMGIILSDEEESDLKRFMFKKRDKFDFGNLTSFRPAVLEWISSRGLEHKKAYPKFYSKWTKFSPNNEIAWSQLAMKVRSRYLKTGDEKGALVEVSSELRSPENIEFAAWYKFKFGTDKALYDLNDKIKHDSEGNMNIRPNKKSRNKFALYDEDNRYYLPKYNQPYIAGEDNAMDSPMQPFQPAEVLRSQEEKEKLESGRAKLVNRTFAIDKLLEKYRDVIGDEQLGVIEDALNMLRKKVRSLRVASMVNDTVIKTANQLGKRGLPVGRLILLAAAEEFTGKPSSIVKEAMEGLSPLITELQRIDQSLKRRDLARDIARIDFYLHDMNLSGLFPELTDAQGRLIEAYTYASNKIKEIIPKMRSTQPGAAGISEVIPASEMNQGMPELPSAGPAPELPAAPTPLPNTEPTVPPAPKGPEAPVSGLEKELSKR